MGSLIVGIIGAKVGIIGLPISEFLVGMIGEKVGIIGLNVGIIGFKFFIVLFLHPRKRIF